ncbi:unnamed protein product, partial [Prorocentrum cordatum]
LTLGMPGRPVPAPEAGAGRRRALGASGAALLAGAGPAAAGARSLASKIQAGDMEVGFYKITNINTANMDEYRQFPRVYPACAALISQRAQRKPFSKVSDIFDIDDAPDGFEAIMAKYVKYLTVDPSEAGKKVPNGLG